MSPDKPPVAHIVIKGVAFYFVNISNLTLQYNALQFLNIYTMVMDSVHIIVNYHGYGLYAHNILGKLSIRNCKFLNNSAKTCNNDGGNTKITYDGFTDIKHNILQISNSAFGYSESSCNAQNGVLHIEVMSTVGIEQYYLSTSVSDCILYNNKAFRGENMWISFPLIWIYSIRHLACTVSIKNNLFVSGTAITSGDGLYIDYFEGQSDNSTTNVYIYNSTFLGNGGALGMTVQSKQFSIHIWISTFFRNEARDQFSYGTSGAGGTGAIYLELISMSPPLQNATEIVVFNIYNICRKQGWQRE